MKLTMYSEEAIPTGVYYQVDRPVFGDHLTALQGATIVERTLSYTPERARSVFDAYK